MIDRPSFISIPDYEILKNKYKKSKKLHKKIKKIENGYPIQYVIGNVEFLDLKILLNKHVLIPRFETEFLVHELINYIKKYNISNSYFIDLCTGSGCIGLVLKKNFPNSNVTLVDKSYRALVQAKKNANYNKLNVEILKKDVLTEYDYKCKYSVLVSNPPYVILNEEVSENTKYEPQMALYPGEDDTIFYKKILEYSKNILNEKNIICFEIGSTQTEKVRSLAKKIYPNSKIIILKDFNNYDRGVFIFNNCE